MSWQVLFHDIFENEFKCFTEEVQNELLAQATKIQEFGPVLGRPSVDTLNGSKYSNMKELRFTTSEGVWRVAFAFDPERQAILLVAGDKKGKNQKKFYAEIIRKADQRFEGYLKNVQRKGKS